MNHELTCTQCLKVFTAKSRQQVSAKTAGRAVFCGDDCYKAYKVVYQHEYNQKNKRYLAAKRAGKYRERYERTAEQRREYARQYKQRMDRAIKQKHSKDYYQRTRTLQLTAKGLGVSMAMVKTLLGITKRVYVPDYHFGVGNL